MKTFKKLCVVVCTVMMVCSLGSTAFGADPFKITFLAPFYQAQPPSMTNGVIAKFEEITNTKIQATWIPDPSLLDKFSLMIASGNLPMVVYTNGRTQTSGVFINACRLGLFWELPESLLQQYPNLWKFIQQDQTWTDNLLDGKNYSIPIGTDTARVGLIYRKDWLNKLGLKTPETVEDFYNVAKAFTEQDPDGNGQNDTYGFGYIDDGENEQAFAGFDWIMVTMGGYNKWGVKDGKFVAYWETPEYIETMKLFKKMYDNKYMNQDFALQKGAAKYQAINEGKVGMMITTATNLETKYTDLQKLMKVDSKDWLNFMDVVPRLKSPDGQYRLSAINAVKASIVFTKRAIKTEEDLKKVLQYFDTAADENGEIRKVYENGIQGKHYDKLDEKGLAVRTDAQAKAYRDEVNELSYLRYTPIRYSDWEARRQNRPVFLYTSKLIIENTPYAVKDPSNRYMPLSETYRSKGADLAKIISDARVKFIMGQLDEAGFKKEVQRWKEQGGDKIAAELTAEYAKGQK